MNITMVCIYAHIKIKKKRSTCLNNKDGFEGFAIRMIILIGCFIGIGMLMTIVFISYEAYFVLICANYY